VQHREGYPQKVKSSGHQDLKIEPAAHFLNIMKIAYQLAGYATEVGIRFQLDLSQTSDSRQYHESLTVTGQRLLQLAHEFRSLRTRTNQAHLAPDYVDQLR
jgi:hypothetical protein